MSVTLDDKTIEQMEKMIESRISAVPSDKLLRVVLGDFTDGEIEVLTRLRQVLRDSANGNSNGNGRKRVARRAARPTQRNGRSVAIGRHAYDYLAAQKWEGGLKSALQEATPRRTLVGLRLPSDTKPYANALREGAAKSRRDGDELTASRLEKAAERLAA